MQHAAKALPCIFRLLQSQEAEVISNVLWVLAYISDGDERQIELILSSGVLSMVLQALGSENDDHVLPAIRVLGNIATGSHAQTEIISSLCWKMLIHLPNLLNSKRSDLKKDACWLISKITAGTPDQIQMVIDAGLLSRILNLCNDGASRRVRTEAFWTFANLAKAVGGKGVSLTSGSMWRNRLRQC